MHGTSMEYLVALGLVHTAAPYLVECPGSPVNYRIF